MDDNFLTLTNRLIIIMTTQFKISIGAALLLGSAFAADAATTHHRLVWDKDPAHNAVIGFSPNGSSTNPYVKFGYSTDEATWTTAQVSATRTFQGSLTSHFVRLSGLTANSAVYYRVCDNGGCGDRLWFKTAPTDNTGFVAVAGGDTRTGWTNRRDGNALIAKIRPLFIMHGGDFTNANNVSEMNEFLSDWALTYSPDTINGVAYKRIYPVLPTHGNHEDNNYNTLCQVFGTDFNGDGQCNATDTYGSFNVSPLLRVYTLNSQFKNSGWSSYASAMNSWLNTDLSNNGSGAKWRFAQYHKPMFPHYSGKSDNTDLHNWWSDAFYNQAMNLVVESDTHINKLTKALKPSGSSFVETTSGGTVYVGEGSWGAPARSANDPKSWTIDLASIQQFKVLSVSNDAVEVRTAQFDGSAGTLSRTDRASNPLALPANVNWWHANGVGETLKLVQNTDRRTVIDDGSSGGGNGSSTTVSFNAVADTFIAKNKGTTNYNGSNEGLLADGSDTTYGVMDSLIKWDLSSIPSCATVSSATVEVKVTNVSSGAYNAYLSNNAWTEAAATWDNVNGTANRGTQVGSFVPSSTGIRTISLNASAVQGWLSGSNNGIVIASGGTSNGLDMDSKETGTAPKLTVVYTQAEGCGSGGGGSTPVGGTLSESNLSASKGGWLHYTAAVSCWHEQSDGQYQWWFR